MHYYFVTTCTYLHVLPALKVHNGVLRAVIDHFIHPCLVCRACMPHNTWASLKPIVASGFMSRKPVCLILKLKGSTHCAMVIRWSYL